jgi:hypothetical protein
MPFIIKNYYKKKQFLLINNNTNILHKKIDNYFLTIINNGTQK